jgi:hypothetical protein
MKMKRETQALHLAKIMQDHIKGPSYEFALPLVMVSNKKLKKLSVDNVLLTGFDTLDCILIDEDEICANLQLKKVQNLYSTEIIDLQRSPIESSDSKKYEILKFSFGRVHSKVLEPGQIIDITHLDLESVDLVLNDQTIAEGSLVNVDDEIAIKIKRVLR